VLAVVFCGRSVWPHRSPYTPEGYDCENDFGAPHHERHGETADNHANDHHRLSRRSCLDPPHRHRSRAGGCRSRLFPDRARRGRHRRRTAHPGQRPRQLARFGPHLPLRLPRPALHRTRRAIPRPLGRSRSGIRHRADHSHRRHRPRRCPARRAACPRSSRAVGVEHEILDPARAAERWPQFTFDTEVLWHPDAGVIDAETTVKSMLDLAGGHRSGPSPHRLDRRRGGPTIPGRLPCHLGDGGDRRRRPRHRRRRRMAARSPRRPRAAG
jgi:hypothetical protein